MKHFAAASTAALFWSPPTRGRELKRSPRLRGHCHGGGCLTPFAIFGSWDFTSDRSAAKSHLRQLLSPSPRGNIAIFRMPSPASRSDLSSLSSCVMILDERDGSDERDGRGDDVGFHVGSFRTEISCRGVPRRGGRVRSPCRHENKRTGGCGAAGGADAFGARAGTKTGEQEIFYGSPSRLLFSCFQLDHARRGPARK